MSTARVIHFGSDDCHRVQELQRAGYDVLLSNSLDQLRLQLSREADVLGVLVLEETPQTAEQVAALVRQHSGAPLILFRRSEAPVDENLFDRVYGPLVPPPFWLFETAVLVEQCRTLAVQNEALRAECKMARRNIEWQRARARLQRKRNTDSGGLWKLDPDQKA